MTCNESLKQFSFAPNLQALNRHVVDKLVDDNVIKLHNFTGVIQSLLVSVEIRAKQNSHNVRLGQLREATGIQLRLNV